MKESLSERNFNEEFINTFDIQAQMVHATAIEKGWWEGQRNDGELIALSHSELSEAL